MTDFEKAPYYVGLDISITGTGVVVLDKQLQIAVAECVKTKPQDDWYGRVNNIVSRVFSYIPAPVVCAVFVEDYAFAAKGQVFNIAELSGIIKFRLWSDAYPFLRIPPTSLKKFTTATGTAPKELMMKEVYKRYGVDFNDNNVADAYALARMGYAITQQVNVPAYQKDAIKNVWKNNKITESVWASWTEWTRV